MQSDETIGKKNHRTGGQMPGRCGKAGRARHLIATALGAMLILSLVWGLAGNALAEGREATPASASSALAVVRAAGASLYDTSGNLIQNLPKGTALSADGRTADARWVSVSTAAGLTGWVQTSQLVLFALDYLPVMSGWTEPVAGEGEGIAASSEKTAETATSGVSRDAARHTGTVTTRRDRLNVRAGPGTGYQVIAKLSPGETVTATARNADADWVQVDLPTVDGGFGWASGRYLSLAGEATDLPVSDQISDALALPAGQPGSSAATGLTGKLVFQGRSGGTIYVYDLDTNVLRSLTTGADPAISPDGQTVAFWRGGGGNEHNLHLIGIDGSNERRILTRGEMLRAPKWSPDGQRIVFSRVVGQKACRYAGYGICLPDLPPYNMFPLIHLDQWGLSRVDPEGQSFLDLATVNSAIAPDWDEWGIVYQSNAGIQIKADEHDTENRLVLSELRYQDPALQPGGGRVIFHSLEKDHWEIFSANADGSNVVALTRPATTLVSPLPHNLAPAWSPDGRSIIFLSNRGGTWALWVMDADGSNQRQLPIDVPIEYNYQVEQAVSWGR